MSPVLYGSFLYQNLILTKMAYRALWHQALELSQLLVKKIEWNKFHFANLIAFKMITNLTSAYTIFPEDENPIVHFFLTQSVHTGFQFKLTDSHTKLCSNVLTQHNYPDSHTKLCSALTQLSR